MSRMAQDEHRLVQGSWPVEKDGLEASSYSELREVRMEALRRFELGEEVRDVAEEPAGAGQRRDGRIDPRSGHEAEKDEDPVENERCEEGQDEERHRGREFRKVTKLGLDVRLLWRNQAHLYVVSIESAIWTGLDSLKADLEQVSVARWKARTRRSFGLLPTIIAGEPKRSANFYTPRIVRLLRAT